MGALEIITIVLSLVALTITIVGFFASLKFYHHGMEMQGRADRVLAQIEERSSAIQTQVGGIFDKTLDAALARTSSQEAEEQQTRMLRQRGRDTEASRELPEEEALPATGLAAQTELAQKVFQYYAFRKLRVSDVSDSNTRAVFNLGSSGGFNLLDGMPGIVFLGYFVDVEPAEIVARTRVLFTNLEISYKRLDETVDPALRSQAERILDQISVELLVADSVDSRALAQRIDEFQPAARALHVEIHTPQELVDAVETEFRRMEP